MTEFDSRIEARMKRSVELLRAQRGPAAGAEDRVLESLEVEVGGAPDGGGSDGGAGSGEGPPAGPFGAGAGLGYAVKVVAATVALTALGLGGLHLGARALGPSRAPAAPASASARVDAPEEGPAPRHDGAREGEESPADEAEGSPAPAPARAEPVEAPLKGPRAPRERRGSVVDADSAAAELALIEAARVAGDPDAVIEGLEAHAREFPEGLLVDERELLWTLAECERGQLDAATARARSFIERRPSSPLVERMLHACPELEGRITRTGAAGHG